jgi:hypothetical protein
VQQLSKEFGRYNPNELFAGHIADVMKNGSEAAVQFNHIQFQN